MANKQYFNVLGWIGLAADLISLGAFILSGNALQFWSPIWFIGIVLATVFLAAAVFFFSIGNSPRAAVFMPLVGGVYGALSCIAFLAVFVALSSGNIHDIESFAGSAFLFVYPAIAALVLAGIFGNSLSSHISYWYATTALIALVGLMVKYLIVTKDFSSPILAGEAAMLIGIGFAFIIFHDN